MRAPWVGGLSPATRPARRYSTAPSTQKGVTRHRCAKQRCGRSRRERPAKPDPAAEVRGFRRADHERDRRAGAPASHAPGPHSLDGGALGESAALQPVGAQYTGPLSQPSELDTVVSQLVQIRLQKLCRTRPDRPASRRTCALPSRPRWIRTLEINGKHPPATFAAAPSAQSQARTGSRRRDFRFPSSCSERRTPASRRPLRQLQADLSARYRP
jgi:hypothetical protein